MPKDWYRLDTAALIFPAVARRDWCNVFRVSATLTEDVTPDTLQNAVNDLSARFPSFYVSLRRGVFWYYLEKSRAPVTVRPDYAYPLVFMGRRELQTNCMRVLYYKNRVAVECFHALSDGRGGIVFLCNLVARYLELKHGIKVPAGELIYDLSASPQACELEDSFLKNASPVAAKRPTERSFVLRGEKTPGGFKHLITGIADTDGLVAAAHRYGVSVTAFLASVMVDCVSEIQDLKTPRKKQKPVNVTVPVDLRRIFKSRTLRNFSLVLNVGIDPRFGDYTLQEICSSVYHQMRLGATRQNMAGMIAANVQPQNVTLLRLAPVFIKNAVMDAVYRNSGEGGGSLNVSNLSVLELPPETRPYVSRLEFIIGPQRSYPNNCSVLSYGDKTYINMIRNVESSDLERRFFSRLVEEGVPVEIESNGR